MRTSSKTVLPGQTTRFKNVDEFNFRQVFIRRMITLLTPAFGASDRDGLFGGQNLAVVNDGADDTGLHLLNLAAPAPASFPFVLFAKPTKVSDFQVHWLAGFEPHENADIALETTRAGEGLKFSAFEAGQDIVGARVTIKDYGVEHGQSTVGLARMLLFGDTASEGPLMLGNNDVDVVFTGNKGQEPHDGTIVRNNSRNPISVVLEYQP